MNTDTQNQQYLKNLTLLYVEDEDDVFEQAIQLIARFCGTLLTARNGAEGLEVYHAHHSDIIITDILMPVMDGLTMAAEIRKVDQKVPIVMLTAFEQTNYLMRSIEIGVDKYVIKPINISHLSDSLLDCAHRLRIERQLLESEERFRRMFEDSPDANMLLHDGLFIDCNRGAEKLLRCERQQICGQKPELFSPLCQPDGRLSSEVAEEKTAEAVTTGKSSYEWLQQRPDGSLFWADISLTAITMQGRQVLFSSWRDVSLRRHLEKKLQQSHDLLTDLSRQIPGLVFQYQLFPDGHSCFPYVSDAVRHIFGVSPEQANYDAAPVFAAIHPDDHKMVMNAISESASTLQPWQCEYRVSPPDQAMGLRWCYSIAQPQQLDNGCILWHGFTNDITAKKDLEQQLRKATEAANTLDGLSSQICVINQHGAITSTNLAWDLFTEEYTGNKELRLVGVNYFASCQSVLGGDDQNASDLIAGITAVLNGALPEFSQDYQYHSIDKEYWFTCKASPFSVDGLRYAVIAHIDISWRKAAEINLQKLSLAIAQSPVAIVITDANGVTQFVNPHFTELSGYTAEEALGQPLRILAPDESQQESLRDIWPTITAGQTWGGEFTNNHKDGNSFIELAKISPVRDEHGNITNFVAISEDITERKKIEAELVHAKEEAEAGTRAKSSFLATMSHEIRTPMNGILGMNGMLLETQLTSEQREYAEIVRKSSESLMTIINEILDFSKIEAGKLDLELLDFDLRITLEDIAELLALRGEEAGLEMICNIDPALPSYLKGDPGRLRQIITNLTGNAIKFTRKGEVIISASRKSEQDGYVTILFEIKDTGIGIPESRIAAIFDPFTQADGSTTRKFGGTGLGLAICKQLTCLMGGEIGVQSEVGIGSTFWFTLSFEKQTEESASVLSVLQQAGRAGLTNERLLVVDDNATNRILMKTLLSQWGCRHDVAAHGEEGMAMLLEAVRSGDPYRIAILDQEMPDIDGVELGRQIKANTSLSSTLLVMLTSIAQRGDAAVLEKIGFAGYLHKPVRQGQLYDCLVLALARDNVTEAGNTVLPGIITRHMIAEQGRPTVRILLVEDNIVNQAVAKHMLKSLGYSVDVAADGQEALQALKMINYDLVFMDCQMPVMNGYEATAAIRSDRSGVQSNNVPIIAMTANATMGDREQCLHSGMDDYLAKPVKKEQLAEMIEKWLGYESVQVSNGNKGCQSDILY